MATDLTDSFTEQYNSINTKLKKRFMRKPNVTEATNEFNALAIHCEHSEQPSYAGQAYIGAAKCEALVGNFLGEAEYYLAAARQYMKAEMKLSAMKCYSPAREDLESAIGCFMQALNKYPENESPLRTSILLELANDLVILGNRVEAIHYYERALENLSADSMLRLKCLSSVMTLNIDSGRLDMALETANKISDSKIDFPENIKTEVQATRILLSLLVESPKHRKHPSLEKLISDLLDDDETLPFNCDLRLRLQSLVVCARAGDAEALREAAGDARSLLTARQHDLLMDLVRNMEREV